MFKKDSLKEDDMETIIGPSVKLEGAFTSDGDVTIEGYVKGALATTKNLRIGERAVVDASVKAANAVISGTVNGPLDISGKLEILSSGRVNGDVLCTSIIIQEGAVLNGTWKMGSHKTSSEIKDARHDAQDELKHVA
jgi:cytoskeletal protein CcmA (bactofilin family)